MNRKIETRDNWINPLLSQLDLVHLENGLIDFKAYRTQLEEFRLPERIRQIVAGVNGTAGYHVLELLDFLPPQRTVLRVNFAKEHTENIMELVLRQSGPTVKFYSLKKASNPWSGFFPTLSRRRNRSSFLDLGIHPAEVLDDHIQAWLSYLLSGFAKKFKPRGKQPLSENSQLHLSAAIGKASA
jgi:hypothetical protein